MQLIYKFLALFLICLSPQAKANFLPADVSIDPDSISRGPSQISETQFKDVINRIRDAYSPVASRHGGNLMISGDWTSEKIFAGANQVFMFWQVTVTGGLARQPDLTPDALALIVCHEVGHHLGGFPFRPATVPVMETWAANEGQADYFSTEACSRKL